MKAIEIINKGSAGYLQMTDREIPVPQKGEVLVKVHAAGINRPDVLQRIGRYVVPKGAPDIPGLEIAGEIIGGDVSGSQFRIGDMVCALVQGGGYAEYCIAPVDLCLPIPKGLTAVEAASLPETTFTVWSNVFDMGKLKGDETLLVQAGASGIGVTAIQMAKAMGHRVFATARTEDKCRACEKIGAERCINSTTENFAEYIRAADERQRCRCHSGHYRCGRAGQGNRLSGRRGHAGSDRVPGQVCLGTVESGSRSFTDN